MDNLYKKYNRTIFKYIFYLVQNEPLAEDFMQETFLKAFKSRHSFRKESNDETYLRKIARNIVYDYFRRKKLIAFLPYSRHHEQSQPDTVMNYILQNEDRKELFEALSKLKITYREVLILRKIEQFSLEETAEILGWKIEKVKNTQRAALKALKQVWKEVDVVGTEQIDMGRIK